MKSRGTDYHSESEPLTIAVQTPSERRQQYVPSSASQTRYIISFLTFAVIVCGSVMIYLGVKLAHVEQSSEDHVQPFCPRDERATQGMVSTTHYLASEAGISILRQGGNAWDAAAAVQFMLNVVQPQSTGIGGGLFAMSYVAKNGTIWALDGREEAPERFNDTSFCANPDCRINAKCECTNAWPFDDRKTGGHPVGVPGTVAAIIRLHADFGSKKLSLSHLLQPAIDVAKNGFPMYQEMYDRLNLNRDRMIQFDATKKLFFNQKGDMPVDVGELFYNPDLAKTFELLAAEGEDVFYKGQLAHEIIDAATKAVNPKTNLSSVLSLTDFTGYRAVYREAIHTTYHNYHIYGMPMPSSGGVGIGMTLNMLSSWDISSMHPEDGEYMHRLIDVQDMMWADRHQYMGDADWIPVPTHGLINTSYATQRVRDLTRSVESARIHANGTIPYGNPLPYNTSSAWPYASGTPSPKQGTTHMVIVDRWGNVVSLTTTIEENFGSGVVVPNRGFLLNNELTDFEPLPKDPSTGKPYANGPEGGKRQRHTALGADSSSSGGKRPMSSMSPTIVLRNNKPYLAMGSPGGATIIGTVLNALMGVLAFDMCVADAIALPRLISQNNIAQAEPLVFNRTDAISLLTSRGFQLQKLQTARPLGYVEGVRIIDGVYYGGADTTRLGTAKAIGY